MLHSLGEYSGICEGIQFQAVGPEMEKASSMSFVRFFRKGKRAGATGGGMQTVRCTGSWQLIYNTWHDWCQNIPGYSEEQVSYKSDKSEWSMSLRTAAEMHISNAYA